MKTEITITKGFIVACMQCHQQIGTAVDTHEEAVRQAKIHFAPCDKPHDGHTVTITPTELVQKKK